MHAYRIIICGAGEVGGHTAEVLSNAGHSVTVIDANADHLRAITEMMDVRALEGNAASSEVLAEAGIANADVIVAATDSDEVNLVAASVGRAMGANRAIARVHHSAFLTQRGLDYRAHFNIDRLLCPEFSTATAIARALRNPAALAIESFAGGQIDMHEFSVSKNAPALDKPLSEVPMPPQTRLAAVLREGKIFVPEAGTRIEVGDRVILIGGSEVFDEARRQFRAERPKRREIVLMGGTPMAVWLCRALRERVWSIRLFETRRERAEELAEKLDWVTVLCADPTDKSVFAEERIAMAGAFVSLLDHDEDNIVGSVFAKANGVAESIAVVQRSRYLDLLYHIGVDQSFSPGTVAAREILDMLDENPLRLLATLAGEVDAYIVRVGADAEAEGRPLRTLGLAPDWVLGAIRRDEKAWVPGAEDVLQEGDMALLIGRRGQQEKLRSLLVGN